MIEFVSISNGKGVKALAKEAMRKIHDAEERAQAIREEAVLQADQMVAMAAQKGREHYEKSCAAAESENEAKLAAIRTHAEEVLAKTRTEAEKTAAQMKKIAQPRTRDAVKRIVQGIVEQCR